jgi:hypothetical protein
MSETPSTTAEISRRFAELEGRLARLEARDEILELIARYSYTIDYHNKHDGLDEGWVDCFAPDGVWDIRSGPYLGHHEGRDQLRDFIAGHVNTPADYQHLAISPRIAIDGDRAKVDSYLVRVEHGESGPKVDCFGRYTDEVVRCTDGRWRFQKRTIELDSTSAS